MKWKDIGVNENWDYTGDAVQLLDPDGSTKILITYYSPADVEGLEEFGFKAGWWDRTYTLEEWSWEEPIDQTKFYSETPVQFGDGFIFMAASDDTSKLVYSGEVANEDREVTGLTDLWVLTGNCMPVDYAWKDVCVNESWDYTGDAVQLLNPDGSTKILLTYYSSSDVEGLEEYGFKPGWWDRTYTLEEWSWEEEIDQTKFYNEEELPAGAGFIFMAASDGVSGVILPSPLQ